MHAHTHTHIREREGVSCTCCECLGAQWCYWFNGRHGNPPHLSATATGSSRRRRTICEFIHTCIFRYFSSSPPVSHIFLVCLFLSFPRPLTPPPLLPSLCFSLLNCVFLCLLLTLFLLLPLVERVGVWVTLCHHFHPPYPGVHASFLN